MLTNAYVNHGRWCVDCPTCNTSWLVDAAAPFGIFDAQGHPHDRCFCGASLAVQFPADRDAIDERLAGRPEANRNWRPGESVVDLRIENAANGMVS